eukprot:TRINITY_DN35252_c0_g1_i2.p1 TRINITY_DN35252_c0_g1~~TRINITY_DN35252_c0_g1_i2.p1  ORF type:complete len:466 (+),score=62.66 TRINITY_DN35252_c0_g1_i2:62-1459(+)
MDAAGGAGGCAGGLQLRHAAVATAGGTVVVLIAASMMPAPCACQATTARPPLTAGPPPAPPCPAAGAVGQPAAPAEAAAGGSARTEPPDRPLPGDCPLALGTRWCLQGADPSRLPWNDSGPAARAGGLRALQSELKEALGADSTLAGADGVHLSFSIGAGDNSALARAICGPRRPEPPTRSSRWRDPALQLPLLVEVGAFDGNDAMIAARAGCRVLSVEASPPNFARAKAAIANASAVVRERVTLLHAAAVSMPVHRKSGGKVRAAVQGETTDSLASAAADGASHFAEVPTVVLAELLKHEYYISALKVDVEGTDLSVLEGAKGLLSPGRVGALAFEFSPLRAARTFPGGRFDWAAVRGQFAALSAAGYHVSRSGMQGPWRRKQSFRHRHGTSLGTLCRLSLASGWATYSFGSFVDVLAAPEDTMRLIGDEAARFNPRSFSSRAAATRADHARAHGPRAAARPAS